MPKTAEVLSLAVAGVGLFFLLRKPTPSGPVPTISLGGARTITLPANLSLAYTTTNILATAPRVWSATGGGGQMTVADAQANPAILHFTAPGAYTVKLSITVAGVAITDTVLVTVNPPATPEFAVPAGTVSVVDVAQRSAAMMQAFMGIHLAPKAVGAPISVNVAWRPAATREGVLVPWDYRITWIMRNSATNVIMNQGILASIPQAAGLPVGQTRTTTGTVPGATAPGDYSLGLKLLALSSDPAGLPVGPYVEVAALVHTNAIHVA